MCDAFASQLSATKSRAMAQRVLSRFKTLLRDAQKRGLIAHNPAGPVKMPSNKRGKSPSRIGEQIPSKADVRTILAASSGRWHTLFLTAAFTGMRTSELRGLMWKDVDLDRAVIHVYQRVDRFGELGSCKSASGNRDIQIGHDVTDALRRWKLVCPSGPLHLVFPNTSGDLGKHNEILQDGWYKVQRATGITQPTGKPKYKFHSLRHFFASIMIEQGTPVKRLQSLLGHATVGMTMDTYGHLFPPGEDEIARVNNAVASVLLAA
jgi:integrase